MNIDLGRVTPIYRGAYSAAESYELNDIVLHTDGALYWHTSETPTTGVAPTVTATWTLAFSGSDVEAAIEAIKEDAEAIALGTRGGVPVGSSDPYYHNNAAWYASQASASATDANAAKVAAQGAQDAAETARDKSAQWATGGTTGTPGAENNSKYYAEQAAASAAASAASASASAANTALAAAFDPTKKYATGDLCVYSGGLYVFTAAHEGAWDAADVMATTVDEQLEAARALALDVYPTEETSGAVASTELGADVVPLKSLIADIVAVWEGTGTPATDNIRAIEGFTGLTLSVSDEDTENPETVQISWQDEVGTLYGGTLNVLTGVLTVTHWGHTFDGTEEFTYYSSNHFSLNWFFPSGYGIATSGEQTERIPYSSHYPVGTSSQYSTKYCQALVNTVNKMIFVRPNADGDDNTVDIDSFRTYLATQYAAQTPVQIVWTLRDPKTYQLTPIEVKSLLGETNVWVNTGDVSATFRLDPALYVAAQISASISDAIGGSY